VKRVITLFILLLFSNSVFSQEDQYLTISNSRNRAVAMGGAITAIEDDIGAISFNPATFSLSESNPNTFFSFHINPVLPIVAYRQQEFFDLDRKKGFEKAINNLKYFVKSVTFRVNAVNIGFVFNEEKFQTKDTGQFFSGIDFPDNNYHSAIVNVNLSSQVKIGVSGSIIRNSDSNGVEEGGEVSYGILVKPNSKYQIGIMFIDFANRVKNFRKKFDRLADESLNAGLAFFPWSGISLSLDVRNLTENSFEETFGLQEFHAGFESTRIKHLSIRGGFFREKLSGDNYSNIFSAGVGIIDLNRLRSSSTR